MTVKIIETRDGIKVEAVDTHEVLYQCSSELAADTFCENRKLKIVEMRVRL